MLSDALPEIITETLPGPKSAALIARREQAIPDAIHCGAEADENAVKVAKAFTKRPNIIVFSGAFHGRTLLTMSMTAKKAYAKGMGPFPDGVYRAEFPYIYRRPAGMPKKAALSYYIGKLKEVFENCSPAGYVAAIVVEPLQGEGGFIPAPIEWIKDALACAAALKTIEIMERDHLAERPVSMGRKVMARYEEWKQKYGVIGDVRGFGGMVGIEFVKDTSTKEPAPELTKAIIEENARHGLLVEGAGIYGNVIRFLAPLVMTNVQLEAGLRIFEQSIRKCIGYEETGHAKVGV
ncbi:aminotransferase class III-fold pyridoxal phosphate-dependent enzyme [uncultured Mitsuokella sp.]|uniref:aminotransferase class III-fold pyridoxal phosphate-dependent enzyme n=1 Tax=uncultured Mitsuokella sp. TaxID=453120 RepID=UPI00266E9BE2|nr:aminotransferase class III-fold pyridoxal phosphate-dependent enzyme [uncultured Mitsuokella sp.]